MKVAQALDERGNWDWQKFSFIFPSHISHHMLSTPRNPQSFLEDTISWGLDIRGNYTLKSAYLILSHRPHYNKSPSKWIWKIPCHTRFKFFAWLISHCSIPTNFLLSSRGINVPPFCVLCGTKMETTEHLLRFCCVTESIFRNSPISSLVLTTGDFPTWFKKCASSQDLFSLNISYGTLFIYFLWSIWTARNKKVFEYAPIFPTTISNFAISRAVEFHHLGKDLSLLNGLHHRRDGLNLTPTVLATTPRNILQLGV